MKFALVDDDEKELSVLSEYIMKLLGSSCAITHFHSGEEFLCNWKCGDYDLIVLDIYMGKLLGVDVAKKIRETDREVRLAFCTTSNEFAGESYEVNARYYLRKPITEENVKNMLDRFQLNEIELSRIATLPDGQSVILRSITYAEYVGRTLTIHSKKRTDFSARMLFSKAEEIFLEYPYFCTCSKGVIVNLYEVAAIRDDTFILKSGESVPISRRKIKEVTDAYASLRFEILRQGGDISCRRFTD